VETQRDGSSPSSRRRAQGKDGAASFELLPETEERDSLVSSGLALETRAVEYLEAPHDPERSAGAGSQMDHEMPPFGRNAPLWAQIKQPLNPTLSLRFAAFDEKAP
jgi:hypothetical protein